MSEMDIDELGNKIWRNPTGLVHREDGPAIEYADGAKAWYINGTLHREDGPAVEECWFINGKLHREDEPAFERYYLNGKRYSFENWVKNLEISDAERVMLCLKWK